MAKKSFVTSQQMKEAFDLNDRYFTTHFSSLVSKHGGKWLVLSEGKPIGIGGRDDIPTLMKKARATPPTTPFLAPIPKPEELECAL
jgi:hypothetical protein